MTVSILLDFIDCVIDKSTLVDRIQLNQAVVTNYLANDIKLQHSISDMMRESSISANHIYPERSSASCMLNRHWFDMVLTCMV